MSSIFSLFKDSLLDFVDLNNKYNLRYPLEKTGAVFNNYTRGDFIIIGGRKTSGKSSLLMNNYVISPIVQKISAKRNDTPFDVKVVYINTRKSVKNIMERLIVNYLSYKNNGTKLGVPSLYGYEGRHQYMSSKASKGHIAKTMGVFDTFVDRGFLNVITSRRTIFEIENIIRTTMDEYGTLDTESDTFTYDKEYINLIPIISIDDTSGISGETGSSLGRAETGHLIGQKLKSLAKIYNIIVVLAVPSLSLFRKFEGVHRSSVDEIYPYNIYADRVAIMHNPQETNDKQALGLATEDFISPNTGICYLRTIFIAANYMGPSGLVFPLFLYPENGFIMELPPGDDEEIGVFIDLVNIDRIKN